METRGETSAINDYVKQQVESIAEGAARMYQNEVEIELVGEGISCRGSRELAAVLHRVATEHPSIENSVVESNENAGSEDATYFMQAVQENGGLATYCIFGTELAAGHHNEKFDINEETMIYSVDILFQSIMNLK